LLSYVFEVRMTQQAAARSIYSSKGKQLLAENRRTQFALLSFLRIALVSAISLLRPFGANAQNSHDNGATPRQHSVQHVLLLSVDGMHNLDLANLVKNRPGSALSILS